MYQIAKHVQSKEYANKDTPNFTKGKTDFLTLPFYIHDDDMLSMFVKVKCTSAMQKSEQTSSITIMLLLVSLTN